MSDHLLLVVIVVWCPANNHLSMNVKLTNKKNKGLRITELNTGDFCKLYTID